MWLEGKSVFASIHHELHRLLFSHSVMSDSLQPHRLQHARLPCPSLFPRVCSNSCPLSQWCHLTISSCHPLLLPSIFPSIRVFSSESALRIRWPKYWSFSFSISPSNEYSGLISLGRTGLFSFQSKGLTRLFVHWWQRPGFPNCTYCNSYLQFF